MASPLRSQCRRVILCLAAFVATNVIQAAETKRVLDLPQDPRLWINSTPWSLQQCKGKAIFLYFFEEECPKCAEGWERHNELARKYADDPILFLAISSGTDRQQMEQYAQTNNVRWPIVLDPDRILETVTDVGTINLMNVTQVVTIGPDGQPRGGSWSDMESSAKDALKDAKWSIDPKTIPAALRPTWQQIEFENFQAAAPALNKALKSSKAELKAGAQTLMDVVQRQIDELAKTADTAYDSGDKWPALRTYTELSERFKGYPLPRHVESRKKELQTDPAIKAELAAFKMLENAQRMATNSKQAKKAIALLKNLAKDQPETAAGKKAAELLRELNAE